MKFVCPQPTRWHEIYQQLQSAWNTKGSPGNPPPVPLILNGWAFSDDFDKHQRWLNTLAWAEKNDLTHLIPELTENEKYLVVEFSSYVWPSVGEQVHEPINKPTDAESRSALDLLQRKWNEIAGPTLSEKTYPAKFTGKKRRRLVVSADPEYSPPWGSWHWITRNGDKRSFTEFRASVNRAISPLAVDHIDFVFPIRHERK